MGCYIQIFSTSPENTFLDKDNRECALSESVTMDIALIREVFYGVHRYMQDFRHRSGTGKAA